MTDTEVELVRYVFLDVVGFTHRRSVEAQTDVIAKLNSVVVTATKGLASDEVIFLPTGDGMSICIVGSSAFDSHLQLALSILDAISSHNEATADETRRFEVRVGLNQNSDNIVTDINGRRNIAGTGINMASRVMALGDAGHVLLSSTVHDVLSAREKYVGCFRPFNARIKHGINIQVFQYIADGVRGLNVDPPLALQPKRSPRRRLNEFEGYYIGYGLLLRPLFLEHVHSGQDYAATVLLWFLAKDAVGAAHQTEVSPYKPQVVGQGSLPPEEAFKYYMSVDFWLVCEFAGHVAESLAHLGFLFQDDLGLPLWHFPTEKAKEALKADQPGVAACLGLAQRRPRS